MIQLFFCVTWPQVITILSSFVWYGRICGQRGWRSTESPEWLLETALRATHVHVGVRSTHVKHTTWAAFNWCFTTFSFSAYIGSLIQKKYLSYDLCFSLTYRGLHVTDVLAACTHMCPGTHWGTAQSSDVFCETRGRRRDNNRQKRDDFHMVHWDGFFKCLWIHCFNWTSNHQI